MRYRMAPGRLNSSVVVLVACLLIGCSRSFSRPGVVVSVPIFPPQRVMEDGDYAKFLAENEQALQHCENAARCEVALFNLGFVYAYALSPYRNAATALRYFHELVKKYPRSPWAFQGQAWIALINESLALEKSREQLQADLRTREATIRTLRERLNRSREIDLEIEKKARELLR